MSRTMPVHAAVANALQDHGVDVVYGLMGDANLFMVDHYVRELGGRYVPAAHEAGAVLMALGHASVTNEVAVATITHGPAISNAITALVEGTKGTLPIVVMCGDTPIEDPDHIQALAQRALVEATGAGFEQMKTPATVSRDVATAFRRARLERRPIVLNMPSAMMWEQTEYKKAATELPDLPTAPGESDALNEAIGILASARRPVILAGRGAIHARHALLELADRIGAPVATTLKAKGLFNGAPYDLGVCGTLSTPAASDVIASADCIFAFGAGFSRFTTVHGAFLANTRVVQVDDDPRQLGRRHSPDAMLVGDPELVAKTILKWINEAEIPSSQATDTIDQEALRAGHPLPKPSNAPGTLDYSVALEQIDAAFPEDRIFVSDAGRFMTEAWCRIGVSAPRNMVPAINSGAIGNGMGVAIGAAVARSGQKTLFMCGDGGFMMGGLAEFSSVVREALDMVTVICNDSAYGAEYIQFTDRQLDPGLSTFSWPSFAAMAQTMGAKGLRVSSQAELKDALAVIADTKGPVLLELVLDPASMPRMHA
ncbi:thiamine pyrophosphate-binding protein [Seohaeicola saemankumensis]|uniref:Thiamine pyrophosphate-binding protein n=1 Tax=Seohaeicola saemankumensis TaxID=481181 RepID=A0ABW3TJQ8_9RHOB